METKTNGNLLDGAKVAEKWFNDSSAAMMEIYNKQLSVATNFYKNLSGMGNSNGWNMGKSFTDTLFPNNDLSKWMLNPFSATSASLSNPFMESFEKAYNQLLNYNRNLFPLFNNNSVGNMGIDMNTIGKKYQELMTNQFEASKKIMNTMMETFNKQLEVATETDKKMMEEINEQFSSAFKQDQEFLASILNPNKAAMKEEKSFREDGLSVLKKQTKSGAVA